MSTAPPRSARLAAWLAVPPLFGLLALWLGQDASWDLRNYHHYIPYAWLHERMGHDVAPAQVASFYNPLLQLPFYLAVERLPPRALGFLLGTLQGLNFPLLWRLCRSALGASLDPSGRWIAWAAAAAALLGMLGAGQISELGTTFGDNLLSLPLLAALNLLLRPAPSGGAALAAGLLCGLAAGLKQPMAVYAVGGCAACLALPGPLRLRLRLALVFGLGVLAGMALGGGFWMLEMARRFGNPLFPYFNQFFQSPWGAAGDYRDARFLPATLGEALASPLFFALMPKHLAEVDFRDLRWPLLYLLLLVLAARRVCGRRAAGHPAARLLLVAGGVSYLVWLQLFAIFRYAMLLEMLAPLGIALTLGALLPAGRPRRAAWLAGALLILAGVRPADWGRIAWGESYFGVRPPALERPEQTLVLMTGYDPNAYLIPFFPPGVRFLRIHSYFTGPGAQANAFDRLMRRTVEGHAGPIYALFRAYEVEVTRAVLHQYGLALSTEAGRAVASRFENDPRYPLRFVAAFRHPPADPAAAPHRKEEAP